MVQENEEGAGEPAMVLDYPLNNEAWKELRRSMSVVPQLGVVLLSKREGCLIVFFTCSDSPS